MSGPSGQSNAGQRGVGGRGGVKPHLEAGIKRIFRVYPRRPFRVLRPDMTYICNPAIEVQLAQTNATGMLRWNSEGTIYDEWQEYLIYNPNTNAVCVTIPSLCYLGPIDGLDVPSYAGFQIDSKLYFTTHHRNQLGTHIFGDEFGNLRMIKVQFNRGTEIKAAKVEALQPAMICTIYPNICKDFEAQAYLPLTRIRFNDIEHQQTFPVVRSNLTLGLLYADYQNDQYDWVQPTYLGADGQLAHLRYIINKRAYRRGNRKFCRTKQSYFSISSGNVFEIREKFGDYIPNPDKQMDDFIANPVISQHSNTMNDRTSLEYLHRNRAEIRNRFAIYVCAGAKLVVLDQYEHATDFAAHIRSYVQQGGVVIVENETLEMVLPDNIFAQTPYEDINNKVVFLGANESDFNTISWTLSIERYLIEKYNKFDEKTRIDPITKEDITVTPLPIKRRCLLTLPEGAYIVAIEEWSDGMDEILCRHRYEQLHRTVVRLKSETLLLYCEYRHFVVPNDAMLRKILGVRDRSVKPEVIQLIPGYNPQHKTPLPKEFNFVKPLESMDLVNMRNTGIKPCAPPAYPPIRINGQLYYLPQNIQMDGQLVAFTDVDSHYQLNHPANNRTEGNGLHNVFNFRLSTDYHEFDEYEWTKTGTPDPLPSMRADIRLGVDGLHYKKINRKFGKYKTLFYEKAVALPQSPSTTASGLTTAHHSLSSAQVGQPTGAQQSNISSELKNLLGIGSTTSNTGNS